MGSKLDKLAHIAKAKAAMQRDLDAKWDPKVQPGGMNVHQYKRVKGEVSKFQQHGIKKNSVQNSRGSSVKWASDAAQRTALKNRDGGGTHTVTSRGTSRGISDKMAAATGTH